MSSKQTENSKSPKKVRFNDSRDMADDELAKRWEKLSAAEKSQYEIEASSLYAMYQKEYERVNTLSDQLWTRQKVLKAKGDIDGRTAVKRISPYRVYKRETAA